MSVNRWYPDQSTFGSYQQWEAHRKVLDQVYDLQEQMSAMRKTPDKPSKSGSIPKEGPGSFKETFIAGIRVTPAVPKDGQALKYSAAQGAFIFE